MSEADGNTTEPKQTCADCGSAEVVDTWVIPTYDESGEEDGTEEEPICAKCSAKRELLYFGDKIERTWTH